MKSDSFFVPIATRVLVFCSTILLAATLPVLASSPDAMRPMQTSENNDQKAYRSMTQARQIALALKLYAADNDGAYPATLAALSPSYLDAETLKKLLISPFAPAEAAGYKYHPGFTDADDPKAIVLEDNFAQKAIGKRIVVHLDVSAEALP